MLNGGGERNALELMKCINLITHQVRRPPMNEEGKRERKKRAERKEEGEDIGRKRESSVTSHE